MVGIDEYERIDCLQNAVDDAQKVEQALRDVGVKRITTATNCTYDELTDSTNEYLSKLQKGDVSVVYAAGHAATYRNQNVLLTKTSDKTNLAHTSLRLHLLIVR